MHTKCAALGAALLWFTSVALAAAQDITLTSRDGQVEISGTFLGFDGEFYRVQTAYGELTVDGSGVRCDGPACPNLQDFVAELSISGSATMGAVLMPALVEGFARQAGLDARREDQDTTHFMYSLSDPENNSLIGQFSFRLTNADEGFADLLANEADIVMSLREIRPDESLRAAEAGMGDLKDANRSHVLALDAVVPIVAPGNPVREISPEQLARVFSGQIVNWGELGGPDAEIGLYVPDDDTGLGQAMADQVLKPVGFDVAQGAQRLDTGQQIAEEVRGDPFGLGVTSYAEVGGAQALTLTGTCGRTLRATRRSIKTEDYPLTAPMFLYTPARRLPQVARAFLAYVRTSEAQVVIRRAGFVDQAPEEISVDAQGDRFANAISAAGSEVPLAELQRMTAMLNGMDRLTTSFRFERGSAKLDAQSRANVVQLAARLEQGRYDARRLLLVGFSDGEGPATANRAIAMERAIAVRAAIEKAAEAVDLSRVNIDVAAFGEALPMACDDSAWGRLVNRRVEVWVR